MRLLVARVYTTIVFCALVILSIGWARSYTRPDVIAVFGPGGRPVIVTFGHGAVYVLASNLICGPPSAYRFAWARVGITSLDAIKSDITPTPPVAPPADVTSGGMGLSAPMGPPATTVPPATNHSHERGKFLLATGGPVFDQPHSRYLIVGSPLWLVWPIAAILAGRQFWKWVRSLRRKNEGLCPVCGYDLRESPDRCPECGTVVTIKTVPIAPRSTAEAGTSGS